MTGRLEHKSREGNCWLSMDKAIKVLIVMIQIWKGLGHFLLLFIFTPTLHPVRIPRSYLVNCPLDWNVIQTDPIVLETSDDQYLEAYINCQSLWRPGSPRGPEHWPAHNAGYLLSPAWLNPGKLRPVPTLSPQSCALEPSVQPCNLHPIIKFWTVSMFSSKGGRTLLLSPHSSNEPTRS